MATADTDLFGFINDLYNLLPEIDRIRFGELWTAYEQTYGDVWTRLLQSQLSSVISTLPLYNIQRWLQHEFDTTTQVNLRATYTTNQDVSQGLNFLNRYLIRFSVDGGPQIEVNLTGANPASTTSAEIISKINTAAGFTFATLVVDNALIQFSSPTSGPTSSITFYPASVPTADASGIVLGLDPADLPETFPEFPYAYALVDSDIASIPTLQDKIRVESVTVTLTQNVDYAVSSGIIMFAEQPAITMNLPVAAGPGTVTAVGNSQIVITYTSMIVETYTIPSNSSSLVSVGQTVIENQPLVAIYMWAQNTLYNFETPYNNYGYLMNYYAPNSSQYLKAVQGLWFAYWTGPSPKNIENSLYLLFGLPTASYAGVVSSVTPTTITLAYNNGLTESFTIPPNLLALVGPGDPVNQYQPLVTGITVLDKVNSPGFLAREVGRTGIQQFLTQYATRGTGPNTDETKALKTVEQNTYLPQIDVNAFITTNINLGNVRTFLTNMQPKSRTFLFQVLVGTFDDQLIMEEVLAQNISFDVTPNVDYNPNTYAQQSDLTDAETDPNTGIILDSEAFTLVDYLSIDIYNHAVFIETLHVEG
jgi:hypothetical protein